MIKFVFQVYLVYAVCVTLGACMEMKTCKGIKLDVSEESLLKLDVCLEEAGIAGVDYNEIPAEKLPCIGKCVFKKSGLIDEEGKPHKENILEAAKQHLPKIVHEPLSTHLDKCLSPEKFAEIDNNEKLCLSYVPVFVCVFMAFVEVCAE